MTHWYIVLFVILLFFSKGTAKSYKEQLLIHGVPTTDSEMEFFSDLDSLFHVTFWKKPSFTNRSVQFSLSRQDFEDLVSNTKDMGIQFTTVIHDLQSAFNNQTIGLYIRGKIESFNWQNYYSVEDIYKWLRDLSEIHPKEMKLQTIGQSVQMKDILAVTIDLEESKTVKRSTVIIEGGCHGREWISPAFITYMINTILKSNTSANQELKQIASSHKWIFIPLLNPDGYAYSQTNDRLWRKNIHETYGYGVDLNRNFAVAFGDFGSSKEKKSEDYCGKTPFSEPETSALAKFVKANSDNLQYYISFHSYGQNIIIPYAFDDKLLDNYDALKTKADKIKERSSQKYLIHYQIGPSLYTVGYKASGTSVDWVKKTFGVPYALTIQLPDQGVYGFALPSDRILPICEATMDSILPYFSPENDTLRMGLTDGAKRQKSFDTLFVCTFSFLILIGTQIFEIKYMC